MAMQNHCAGSRTHNFRDLRNMAISRCIGTLAVALLKCHAWDTPLMRWTLSTRLSQADRLLQGTAQLVGICCLERVSDPPLCHLVPHIRRLMKPHSGFAVSY